jgi:hypothetical protein
MHWYSVCAVSLYSVVHYSVCATVKCNSGALATVIITSVVINRIHCMHSQFSVAGVQYQLIALYYTIEHSCDAVTLIIQSLFLIPVYASFHVRI